MAKISFYGQNTAKFVWRGNYFYFTANLKFNYTARFLESGRKNEQMATLILSILSRVFFVAPVCLCYWRHLKITHLNVNSALPLAIDMTLSSLLVLAPLPSRAEASILGGLGGGGGGAAAPPMKILGGKHSVLPPPPPPPIISSTWKIDVMQE